jgi:hypothetical protein
LSDHEDRKGDSDGELLKALDAIFEEWQAIVEV